MSKPIAKRRAKPKIDPQIFDEILQRIAQGEALKPMCENDARLPSWSWVLRFIRDDEAAYSRYREARVLQAETYREQIVKLSEEPLPADPKLAMAEVQRRRLEIDTKDKFIRQLAPSGVRDRSEDSGGPASGTVVIQWGSRNEVPRVVDQSKVIDVEAEDVSDG